MIILLPLSLIGVGALVCFLFNAASHALALAIASAAMFACTQSGGSIFAAIPVGIAAFMLASGLVQLLAQMAPPQARIVLAAALAIPAAIAGYQVGSGLAALTGVAAWCPALVTAALTGWVAATRIARPAA